MQTSTNIAVVRLSSLFVEFFWVNYFTQWAAAKKVRQRHFRLARVALRQG
jgi:hypothetical protein